MLNEVESALRDVYNKFHSDGVEAVYLWGSILTKDFNPATSDVDSIAIVKDSTDLNLENKIKEYLAIKYPIINKFGLRLLFISELNGGLSKGFLSSVIVPNLLILDLPYWKFVAGNKFGQDDFKLKVPSYSEAINYQVDKIYKFDWRNVDKIPEGLHENFLKCLARIIDYQQKVRGLSKGPLSYLEIVKSSNEKELKYAKAIVEIKNNKWSYIAFKKYSSLFQEFVDDLLEKSSK